MSEPTILTETRGAVRLITLHRPQALNSFTGQMAAELLAALEAAAADVAIRAVLVTGAGRGFCAGQDLNAPGARPDDGVAPDLQGIIERMWAPLARRLRSMPVPVVAAVNGVAAGAGANFAIGCDIVLAARSASFIQAFSKIGLIPDAGSTWLLPRRVGMARAMALAMTGDKLPAALAKDWGLIWDVVEGGTDECVAAALAMAEKLAAMPTKALVATRHILQGSATRSFTEQLDVERDTQSAMGRTHDYIEGVMAFREKRPAQFRGE